MVTRAPERPATFRPEIEGLRAVAVLAVVLYHADLGPFRGGYVGVDVFFVISGALITGLLLDEVCRSGGRRCRASGLGGLVVCSRCRCSSSPSRSSRRAGCSIR